MTTFDRREEAYENLFAHDEDMRFKATAHRNKDLATWAAGLMGKSGDEAAAYQKAIVVYGIEHGGEDALVQRLCGDLQESGHAVSAARVRSEMDKLMAEAIIHVRKA